MVVNALQQKPLQCTILGCGASTGVPIILCPCRVCKSEHPHNKRTRASVWIHWGEHHFIVDTSTDFRFQMLTHKVPRCDAILFTHPHADHISGLDDVKAFNFVQEDLIPVYGHFWTVHELKLKYKYIFLQEPRVAGLPQLELHTIDPSVNVFNVLGHDIVPVLLDHGSQQTVGYRFGNLAYLTDAHAIPEASWAKLQNLEVLILDCLRFEPHRTHFCWDTAWQVIQALKPKKTFLTHLSHEIDVVHDAHKLPPSVEFVHDGMKIFASY